MTPSRLRLYSLLALVVPIVVTAIAGPASPGFGALALASAAGGAAILLAGPVFRIILSILLAFLGVSIVLVAIYLPDGGALGTVALVAGIGQVLIASWIAKTSSRWPRSSSRYSRTRAAGDPASDWDALSEGADPTDESR